MATQEPILGRLVYAIVPPASDIDAAAWAAVPTQYHLVTATTTSEALRAECNSTRSPFRVESVSGHHAIMKVEKNHKGIEVNSRHIATISGDVEDQVVHFSHHRPWSDNDYALLVARVQKRIGTMPPQKLSTNSIKFLRTFCAAIGMNRSGGTYFVPMANSQEWDKYTTELASCGLSICQMEVYKSGMNLEGVKAGAQETFLDRIADCIDKLDGIKTDRGFESRLDEANEVLAELELYEDLLGARLTVVREQAQDAQDAIRTAAGLVALTKKRSSK